MQNIDKIEGLIRMLELVKKNINIIDTSVTSEILDEMIETFNLGTKKSQLESIQQTLNTDNSSEEILRREIAHLDLMYLTQHIEDLECLGNIDTESINTINFNKYCSDNKITLNEEHLKTFSEEY